MTLRIRVALSVTIFVAASLLASVLEVPTGASATMATASNKSFATAARAAGYTPAQIALIERHHAQNRVPVSFTSTKTSIGAMSSSANAQTTSSASTKTSCTTQYNTAYATNMFNENLISFTVYVRLCVRTTWKGVPYLPTARVVSHWSAHTVNEHLKHHTFSVASIGGWSYQGLDDSGNWGPSITSSHGLTAQRRAHWHFHIGWGPASIDNNWYPWVRFSLKDDGTGTISTGGSS